MGALSQDTCVCIYVVYVVSCQQTLKRLHFSIQFLVCFAGKTAKCALDM